MQLYLWGILDIHTRGNSIYHSNQLTLTTNNSVSCNDPIYFVYPYYHDYLTAMGKRLHQNLILLHGFKNTSCENVAGLYFDSKTLCAKYNDVSYSKELCNGGRITWSFEYTLVNELTKSKINKMLIKYCNVYHKMDNVCKFKLLTYNMNNFQQRIEFITKHIDCRNNNSQSDKTWLFKELKHQGNGIHFYNNHQLIYSLIGPDQNEEKKYYNKCLNIQPLKMVQTSEYFEKEGFDYIKKSSGKYRVSYKDLTMQEFISTPLLIENRAFHIRTLLLIPSYRNPLIVLQYRRWQIFRNPLEYDNTNLDSNRLRSNSHVANVGPFEELDENGTILFKKSWGYNRFQKYLNETFDHKLFNYTESKMQNDMKDITTNVFKARSYYNRLHKHLNKLKPVKHINNNIHKFDIACMDTIMTDKFEIKFLEINFWCAYYCLSGQNSFSDTIGDDDMFCDNFANEMANILLEIYEKQANGIEITNIRSLNKFELVYIGK